MKELSPNLKLYSRFVVHITVKRRKEMNNDVTTEKNSIEWINTLIDLFVEMNFADIQDAYRIAQFKLVAKQMGYPQYVVDHVVDLGKREYDKLLTELLSIGHPAVAR